ncbi:MAG: fumarylacetoacetate hydrolase family protein [Chloroflexi bacterium]|nr:fumarylacetoacetate hydrolase family protein [Chloroflexota bacterium]
MRLVSYTQAAGTQASTPRLAVERPDGRLLPTGDLGSGVPDTIEALLAGGDAALAALRTAVAGASPSAPSLDAASVTVVAPVPRPGKIIAVGLNYFDHAKEGGSAPPEEPMLFAKFTTSVVGPGAVVEWDPALTGSVDLEAELGVVIGHTARHVPEVDALSYVLGYTCVNDVSARDLQKADKQFVRAKSLDTFCPMGPALVTSDEIPDPQHLAIKGIRNGVAAQDSNTSEMIFSVARIVAFCSRAFTLEPGDVIATGTPAGVLVYQDPPERLRDGDVVTIEIEGIGRLTNPCREVRIPA